MSKPAHVLIAGAGIGGLCAALTLQRAGCSVTIMERSPVLEEAGAGVQISPNASAILRELGVLDRLASSALVPECLHIRRAYDGRAIVTLPLGTLAEQRWGAPFQVVHRADLQRALLESIAEQPDISLETGEAISGFRQDDEGVTVSLTHQTLGRSTRLGMVLIGADGIRSGVRSGMGGAIAHNTPVWSGKTSWRVLVPSANAPAFAREKASQLWMGDNAHLVHYPLRGGTVINVVAIVRDSTPDQPDSVQQAIAVMKDMFSSWDPQARALIAVAKNWTRWPLFDRDPSAHWVRGRVALLGDAAHAMVPFMAQGAAQAIEDAGAIGAAFHLHNSSVPAALLAYQSARVKRAGRIQALSRRQGTIYHLSRPFSLARDMALKALGPQGLLARQDWLYTPQA